ncbi:uncharacterized protein LOC117172498 isoform X2 [Belonocnema kinseyi]|nr:uncharacterized protein LOC117172498 isoform X2 [Belonocnema kinseyi]
MQEQDENNVPLVAKVAVEEGLKNRIPATSFNFLKYDSKNKNRAPTVKSPVLRDRTNEVSGFLKTDLSPIVVLSKIKPKVINKKPEVILERLDQLTFEINSDVGKKEKLHISKNNEDKTSQPPEQIKLTQMYSDQGKTGLTVKRVSRTKIAQVAAERNRLHDASIPKTKKFFKSGNSKKKPIILVGKELDKGAVGKRKIVKKKTRDDSSVSFIVTTPEKCLPGEEKKLRPRQELKNYCEDSKLLEQLSPKKRKSIVVMEKLPDPKAKKLPIWKSVKFHEPEHKGKDIYEISDGDISGEEHRPKKRKKTNRKPVKRLKKAVRSVNTVKSTETVKSAKLVRMVNKRTFEDISKKHEDDPKLDSKIQPRPKMISIEVLENAQKIKIVPSSLQPGPPKEFRPFRVTQVFHRRPTIENNMSDHSLLSKSISPIARLEDNTNLATPWRIPTVGSFSCVRNLVQSTPQEKEIFDRPKLGSLASKSTMIDKQKINRIDENKADSVQEIPRNSKSKISPAKIINVNEKPKGKGESVGMVIPIEAAMQNSLDFDIDAEDKENAVPNYQSPQKTAEKKNWRGTPVFETQPGPSSLQRQPLHEAKILRQTNLNNFLNLDDTPERTQIRTAHGIFDDVHSTPINIKPLKKIYEPNVENAFGFDDDDFDVSQMASENVEFVIPPSKGVLHETGMRSRNVQKESIGAMPLRLPPKEILKTLHKRRIEKKIRDKAEDKVVSNKIHQPNNEHENQKDDQENDSVKKVDTATNFSDTFDLFEDVDVQHGGSSDKNESCALPLFADLEPPTHFVTPPKSIYKRKRVEKFSFSDVSENEENCDVENRKMKKKAKKTCKEDKKLDEWAKNVNKTFQEIDNFDLVVE